MKSLIEKVDIQSVITLVIVLGSIVVYLVQGVLPEFLQIAFSLVLGFYFGNRAVTSIAQNVIKLMPNGVHKT